jgi:hypothetical protein
MKDKPAKPFTERLRDRAASAKARPGLANRAAILAAREDIQAALADRWPVRQIWEQLVEEERIACGYVWFAKHVRDLITSPARSSGAPVKPAPSSDATPPSPAPAAPIEPAPAIAAPTDDPPADPPSEPRPRPTRFHHPESPKKEDYI